MYKNTIIILIFAPLFLHSPFTLNISNNDSTKSKILLEEKNVSLLEKTVFHNQQGKYYENEKQFEKAIENYKKAEKYGKESKSVDEILTALNGLSRSYEKYNNLEDAISYERKLSRLQDSIINLENKNSNDILTEHNIFIKNILFFIFIVIIIIILFLGIKIIKNQHQRKKIQELIQLKENIIYEREEETQELKQKVNESFDEVIRLAKTNSSEFFTRFREVYPEVVIKLLEIYPKFRVSEITLCAYIYLGFNSKDIALYTFKSVNTVRSRKYNLRKKLNISPEENMELWLKSLG